MFSRRSLAAAAVGSLLAIPFIFAFYYLFPPGLPQCPDGYEPPAVGYKCIIGWDFGSVPFFILGVAVIWGGCVHLTYRHLPAKRR